MLNGTYAELNYWQGSWSRSFLRRFGRVWCATAWRNTARIHPHLFLFHRLRRSSQVWCTHGNLFTSEKEQRVHVNKEPSLLHSTSRTCSQSRRSFRSKFLIWAPGNRERVVLFLRFFICQWTCNRAMCEVEHEENKNRRFVGWLSNGTVGIHCVVYYHALGQIWDRLFDCNLCYIC